MTQEEKMELLKYKHDLRMLEIDHRNYYRVTKRQEDEFPKILAVPMALIVIVTVLWFLYMGLQ